MYHLFLIISVAVLGTGCRSANVNRHLKLLDFGNSIESDSSPTKQQGLRRFLMLGQQLNATYAHRPGSLVQLTCEATGSPAPNIRWFKNNAPVYEHDTESNEVIESNPTSLGRVNSTLLVTHTEGVDFYTCLASSGNKVARANTIVYSTVTGKAVEATERSKLLPREPHILVWYKAFLDTIGNTIVLPCKARGHPRPDITWTDNSGMVIVKNPRMKVLRSGELVISPLRWSDMGEFVCRATNAFGDQTASTFLYPAAV